MLRCVLSISICLFIGGCASTPNASSHPATLPASQPVSLLAKNQILVQFETMDCPCALSDINAALMELNGVSNLKWDYDHDRVFLNFLDDRRPTDVEIERAIRPTPAQLKKIVHP